jgi:hypothetical protein
MNTFTILDAARIFGELDTAQKLQSKFLSLYKGQSEELLSSVAPYLFQYQSGSEFSTWLMEKGWGNAWGVFITSKVSLEDLQSHFRKFLMVKTEDGKELYFRFYDPRVLRIFLPTCDDAQLREFFGPVDCYWLEDENPEMAVRFSFVNSKLMKEVYSKDDFLNTINVSGAHAEAKSVSSTPVDNPDTNDKQKPGRGWSFMVD